MTDHTPTPHAELASAALDNEVTADERAIVETTAALTAERDVYGAIREQMSDVTVPSEARESALAAALAVFDELHASPSDDGSPPDHVVVPVLRTASVVSIDARRRRSFRVLGGMAAAAVVGAVAIGALSTLGGSEDKKASQTTRADLSSQSKSAPNVATELAPASIATAAASRAEPTAGTAASGGGAAAPAAAATTAAATTAAATSPAATTAGSQPVVANWPTAIQLESVADVAALASSAKFDLGNVSSGTTASTGASADTTAASNETAASAAPAPTSPDTRDTPNASDGAAVPFSRCLASLTGPYVLAYYAGRPVIVRRDDANKQILVIDAAQCTVTVTVTNG